MSAGVGGGSTIGITTLAMASAFGLRCRRKCLLNVLWLPPCFLAAAFADMLRRSASISARLGLVQIEQIGCGIVYMWDRTCDNEANEAVELH
jgi:hypothetical protein